MARNVLTPEENRDHNPRDAVQLDGKERSFVLLAPTAHCRDVGRQLTNKTVDIALACVGHLTVHSDLCIAEPRHAITDT